MSHVVSIHSAPDAPHVGRIEFSEPKLHRNDHYFSCTSLLALDGEEWLVELEMIHAYRSDMLGFFEELAAAADSGWQGAKRWDSEYGEMRIDASNDGRGFTNLHTFVSWNRPVGEEDWQSGILVARSAELHRLAEEMRRFLQLARGSRFVTYEQFRRTDPGR
jgi:uncharacterized protein DUF6228